jgi:hypothetical protein
VFQIALNDLKRVQGFVYLLSDVFNEVIARRSSSEKNSLA